ncbi:Prefoldin subunit [Lachnellula subtilissima]|uniref:Prefoldin subunit n=1 Tax=Lachnellula subtilissima TaxID=602034 RepID=A0A8H8RNK8_9HELO|nr:Prefoldin subunit [Lachnellula subtilissima]
MAEVQQRLQGLTTGYQNIQQGELHKPHLTGFYMLIPQQSYKTMQKLESQQQENKAVQKEFSGLKDEANIYKMVGPVLLKQDKTEAVLAVDGRLEYIENEIKRVEKQIKDVEDKSDELRAQIMQAQSESQPQGQGPQPQAIA